MIPGLSRFNTSNVTRSIADEAANLLARGDRETAVALVEQAAVGDDLDALYLLATWRLIGSPLPRDVAEARRLLQAGAQQGHAGAISTVTALLANGSGGPPQWTEARALLSRNSFLDVWLMDQDRVLGEMQLNDAGLPAHLPPAEPLSPSLTIMRYRDFLTPDECRVVAETAQNILRPATVIDPESGRQIQNPIRTSFEAVIGPTRENLVVRAINQRIAALTQTHISQGEALTVLRYGHGQEFRPHLDSLTATRNQRIKTVLIYLNDGFSGGETVFPEVGLRIKPRIGEAIVFHNLHADGKPNQRTRHAGLPVVSGVKWLATRWIRARPFDVWTGPESAP